jgi:hypothetical protein
MQLSELKVLSLRYNFIIVVLLFLENFGCHELFAKYFVFHNCDCTSFLKITDIIKFRIISTNFFYLFYISSHI